VTPGRIRSFDLSPDGTLMLVTADGSGRRAPARPSPACQLRNRAH